MLDEQRTALLAGYSGEDTVIEAAVERLAREAARALTGVINGTAPGAVKCPSSGTYKTTTVNAKPTCTIGATLGHVLP